MKISLLKQALPVAIFAFFHFNVLAQTDVVQHVNPFIGTGGHGHTFPGATLPFGMVQLSPDTRLKGWDGCGGYHFSDSIIYGFSHTHLSGTGVSDYGDVLISPTIGKPEWNNKQYASLFSKDKEKASAAYYSVFLEKPKVQVELTATLRSGLHKYTFAKSDAANIQIDLEHRDKVKDAYIEITGDREIVGYRISNKWSVKQPVYFVIQFSKPFKEAGIKGGVGLQKGKGSKKGKSLKAYAQFDTGEGEAILVKVGISAVSIEGARKNLEAEQSGFNFDEVYSKAVQAWDQELSKIKVEGSNADDKAVFYTALYHSMIAPNTYQDVDGKYLGRDRKVHQADGMDYYTVFSLWDTYRALHPLLTIIDRKRTGDFVKTFLLQYDQAGLLPIWELAAFETFCMIGYHSVPVITDAWMKGITDFDGQKALEAMRNSAEISQRDLRKHRQFGAIVTTSSAFRYRIGFDHYRKKGFVKKSFMSGAVSKTLEYAYDDWCIAQMAKALGDTATQQTYIKRAANYKKMFDPATGFMRPRNGRGFVKKFDPFKVDFKVYVEANAWQYNFHVAQDVSGHMALYGGKAPYANFLDSLFNAPSSLKGLLVQDVSGLIGQYAHGNEPSHHVAYLYNYAGQPWKAQAMTRRIMQEMYQNQPDGLSGNEDCGQMSAWYVFSAMGFYPVCPGSDHYAIGSPLFDKISIQLENGKAFSIHAEGNSESNIYIQSARLNGQPYTKSYIRYEDIAAGGLLEIVMGATPNQAWGSSEADVPVLSLE
jgi:predicted alpha-1,2-mannosidase